MSPMIFDAISTPTAGIASARSITGLPLTSAGVAAKEIEYVDENVSPVSTSVRALTRTSR